MTAPGDTPMRRTAIAVMAYCAGTLVRDWSVTKLADILSDNLPRIRDAERGAAEDGARRAALEDAAQILERRKAQWDDEHNRDHRCSLTVQNELGASAAAIRAIATEATSGDRT